MEFTITETRSNGFTIQDNEFKEYDIHYNDYLDIVTIMKLPKIESENYIFVDYMHIGGRQHLYSDDNIKAIGDYISDFENR